MEGKRSMSLIIAYPGTVGSFSYSAARSAFPDAEFVGYAAFEEAAHALTEWKADYALLPVENSSAGVVTKTYALLEKLPVYIVGEVCKTVRHQLLGIQGAKLEDIRVISSHPQAIAQCDAFLERLSNVQIIPSLNTAFSAKEVAEKKDPHMAAIASMDAQKEYGLAVIAQNIQTSDTNTTRFYILSMDSQPLGVPDKATVVFRVLNEVGALVKVLSSFSESGLNMSHIESRPIPDIPFQYFFIADFEGKIERSHLRQAMEKAKPYTQELRLLGTYAMAERMKEEQMYR